MVVSTRLKSQKVALVVAIGILAVFNLSMLVFAYFFYDRAKENVVVYLSILAVVTLACYQILTSIVPLTAKVSLHSDRLEVAFFGGWKKRVFQLSEIDGYIKRFVPGNRKAEKSLVVIAGGKRIAEISGQFTENIDEMEEALQSRLTFSGVQPYNMLHEIWLRMLWR
jgi:hypothetical protein